MDLEPEVVRLEGGGRDADGSQAEGMAATAWSQAEGMAAADGRRYPPLHGYGWDDMSVWLAEIFFEFRVALFRCVGLW